MDDTHQKETYKFMDVPQLNTNTIECIHWLNTIPATNQTASLDWIVFANPNTAAKHMGKRPRIIRIPKVGFIATGFKS
jgi:hypothetical protein